MPPPRDRIALWIVIALGVIDRAVVLFLFGCRYTSFDDAVFWQAARDYACGIFHEPYMYGQDYNPMLESLLAVPGVWLGVPYGVLMPLVTSSLALFPFWSFAIWHHRRGDRAAALLLAATPLLLPVEHVLMTTMTRGFVTGIAMLAFFPWSTAIASCHLRCIAGGCVLACALFINPNAAVLALPIALYALLSERRYAASIGCMVLGALPLALLWLHFRQFYIDHPERLVHWLYDWRMDFHPELITEHFDRLSEHFAWLCPVLWSDGAIVLDLVTLICIIQFLRRRWVPAFSLLSALLIVLASFAYAKTQDGSMTVLMPLSRMYLAMPLLLGWAFALAWPGLRMRPMLVGTGVVVVFCFVLVRAFQLPAAIDRMIKEGPFLPVEEFPLVDLQADARSLAQWAAHTEAGLVVWSRTPSLHNALIGAYTGELFEPGLPPSLLAGYDRRYWRKECERTNVVRAVLFVGGNAEAWERAAGTAAKLGALPASGLDVHVIRNNAVPSLQLIEELGIER